MVTRKLGDVATSEELIRDVYLDLRGKLRAWAGLTKQTSQARMGYLGQHLVSVVTGHEGARSGARGDDIVLANGDKAEIKTCYRVDQLGKCKNCKSGVAPYETECPKCGSDKIERKNDSKWLIGLRNEVEFEEILDPATYYLVLFEFTDLKAPDTIRGRIWEVDPKHPGFVLVLVDYYFNIRAKSKSKAPFNLWPYQLKFELMRPTLIYESLIHDDESIETVLFPGRDPAARHQLSKMERHKLSKVTEVEWIGIAQALGATLASPSAKAAREFIESDRIANKRTDDDMCDHIARGYYGTRVAAHMSSVPVKLRSAVDRALKP